ncbi:MAG: ShlB/FhaC/HecB family hemolysin secretion/activation protein [Gammaproteobacteria bacterium]|nr:ShlB/FhaC/HecB family hemolysin secretion/activation protein [Gammaproteobacteria bacterium]MCF6261415.1 ShlB/FhaC/HecB family hemolysin secretion/activation protein [Gammaproteobacteria bacterium]
MMVSIITKKINALLFIVASVYVPVAMADFLEMPEIEQLRDAEEKTLLRDLDVPAVRDRSPDPTAGPRLAVSEFRIQGLVEFPELGITRETLTQLVENIRFIIMGEGKLLDSGYTIDELGEISDLLVEIEEETIERHVSPLEVQKLVWLIREQRGKRGVTLGQIEAVANKITRFYRERGFILAKAFIPKQRVREGVVSLTLLLGVLGEVSVKNNDMYNAELLQSVFAYLLTNPVTNKAVEENLYIINSFPGINVDGYFEPGYQVGDTRLNINVKNEARYNANLRADNHGTEESGLYRFYADFQINNLLGIADYMKVGLLQAKSPNNTTYWQLAFESNFFSPYFRAGIESSRNQFVVDQTIPSSFDLNGEVDVLGIYGKYIQKRGRTENSDYELRAETIKSDVQIGNFSNRNDELRHVSIKYSLDYLDDANKRLHEGNIKYTRGKFEAGKKGRQDENYNILSADYTLLTFLQIPFTESTSRLIFRSSLQYSGTNLSAIARFSLAGPTRVRGFSPSFFTADDALYLGMDWVFNSPDIFDIQIASINLKSFLKPFVFFDYAYGKQYEIAVGKEDPTGQLADVGVGLQFSHGYRLSGNLQLGYKILDQFTDLDGGQPKADDARLLFDMQYSF